MPARPLLNPARNDKHHKTQVISECIALLCGLMFVVGSFCFLPFGKESILITGDLMFIIASVLYVFMCAHTMWEAGYHENGTFGVVGRAHFMEAGSFLFGALVFTVGTILFWPHLWGDDENAKFLGETWGAWLFIIGSWGFVIGSWFSSLRINYESYKYVQKLPNAKTVYVLAAWALFSGLIGGVCFVTGSWLYRPDLGNDCDRTTYKPVLAIPLNGSPAEDIADEDLEHACRSTLLSGTMLYIVGSFFYSLQGVLNLLKLNYRKTGRSCCCVADDDASDVEEDSAYES